MSRPETGIMKFGNDWRGVFIRGDSCMGYQLALMQLIESNETPNNTIDIMPLKDLLLLLKTSNENVKVEGGQYLKDFKNCIDPEWIEINLPYGPVYGEDLEFKDSFCQRKLNQPGTEIELENGEKYIIGNINKVAGVCDDCVAFEREDIVKRYRALI